MGNTLTKPSNTSTSSTLSATETIKADKYTTVTCNCNKNIRTEARQNREILRELKSIKINLKYLNKKITKSNDDTYFNEKININNLNNSFNETNAALDEKYSW